MGNAATSIGDGMSCFRTHQNAGAVSAGAAAGGGRDIDDAVLAAVNQSISSAQSGLVQTISLSFACENLPNLDTFTRTDGMVVFYKQVGNQWQRIGMTEVIMDNLAPVWVKSFDVQYHFEKREQFRVEVYDVDDMNNLNNFAGHDKVGDIEFSVHEVVTCRDQTLERPLENTARKAGASGTIKITGEERKASSQEEIQMKMRANFPSTSGMNFFLIHKQVSGQVWKPIYKSEIQGARGGAYEWNIVNLLSSDLAGDDIEREIRIDFYVSAKSGKHKHCGQTTLTLGQLKENVKEYPITDKKQRAIEGARMTFVQLEVKLRHSFLEYVFGGCEIGLTVAIDFTLSNGEPNKPSSLHYLDMQRNEYLNAIKSVGNILQYYDSDKQIPVLGFGAAIPPYTNVANHCFALNGNIFDPEVDGIEGVVNAYKNSINRVNLYGPTNFSPILRIVNEMTEQMNCSQQNQKYNILLIITDGIISDLQKTIDQIVYGSELPLSIIIVGVGEADFSAMDELDADEKPLYSNMYKKQMAADIVQFVPFRDFAQNPMMLAKETLEEVPGQMLNYFRRRGIRPNPATEAQKRALQQQLSQARSMGGQMPIDKQDFWSKKKEEFLMRMQQQGLDLFAMQDFIEQKGMPSMDDYLVMDQHQNPAYINPLKGMMMQQPQQQQVMYGYNAAAGGAQPQQQMMMQPQQQMMQPQQQMMMQQQPAFRQQMTMQAPQGQPLLQPQMTQQQFQQQQPQNRRF